MKISVYGSAKPKTGEPQYLQAYHLGELLAKAGHTVITGGYMGSMEAVSRGAADSGAHVIGVTCDEIERWRPTGPNPWVKEEWRTATLFQRIEMMLRNSDAAIALPGGIGTLTEIMTTWNHLAVEAVTNYPFVLVGVAWLQTMQHFYSVSGAVNPADWKRITFVEDVDSAALRVVESA